MGLIPPLAADAVADLLTANVKRPDGKDATAFRHQRDGLVVMRSAVEKHEDELQLHEGELSKVRSDLVSMEGRIAALEARPPGPFPSGGSG